MPRIRRKSTPTQLASGDTPQAMARREHAGRWIAWAMDESHILAVGDTPEEIRATVERAGPTQFIYDWVPPAEVRQTTGPA